MRDVLVARPKQKDKTLISYGRYAKTIMALVAGAIGWASLVVNSDVARITASEWIVGAAALATALGVYIVPNASNSE